MARSSLAGRGVFQRMIGECDLQLRAARALTVEVYERAFQTVSAGAKIEPRLQAEMRAVCAFATAVAAEVTGQAFRYAGAPPCTRRASSSAICVTSMPRRST